MKSIAIVYLIVFLVQPSLAWADGVEIENPSQMIRKPLVSLGLMNARVNYLQSLPNDLVLKLPNALYQEILPHVVKIVLSDKATNKFISSGSAVAITDTLLITNCHILTKNYDKDRHLIMGKLAGKLLPLELEASDASTDRCVLTDVSGRLSPVGAVRSKNSIQIGETVYSVGNPKNFEGAFSAGMISAIQTHKNGRTIILTTAALARGSSGGALFDRFGNLVGITMAVIKDAPHLGIVIPIEDYFN